MTGVARGFSRNVLAIDPQTTAETIETAIRRTTRYLRARPALVEPVAEIHS
jgi:hypothetical protein